MYLADTPLRKIQFKLWLFCCRFAILVYEPPLGGPVLQWHRHLVVHRSIDGLSDA